MILVTGGTGFIGQVLIRHLVGLGMRVRTLLRPSQTSPQLPLGVPLEVVVCSLKDERGLRAGMKGIEMVVHLASAEQHGAHGDLQEVDVESSRRVAQAGADAGVQRIVYLSHLGADRASAFPLLRAKGLAEHFCMQCGVPYTIFRSASVFGPRDHFTTRLARLIRLAPGIMFMPGQGDTLLQPIWIEDLVTCIGMAMTDDLAKNKVYTVGGGEYIRFREIVDVMMRVLGKTRRIIDVSPAYLRILTMYLEGSVRWFPLSIFWQDYLSADRITELDVLPRQFGLIPTRFSRRLDYLKRVE